MRLITIINSHHKSVMLWGRIEIELSDPVRSTATNYNKITAAAKFCEHTIWRTFKSICLLTCFT